MILEVPTLIWMELIIALMAAYVIIAAIGATRKRAQSSKQSVTHK